MRTEHHPQLQHELRHRLEEDLGELARGLVRLQHHLELVVAREGAVVEAGRAEDRDRAEKHENVARNNHEG